MELHAEVPQLDDEVRAKNKLAVCVGRSSHFVSPLLRLVVNRVQINVFSRFPAGAAEYDWLIRLVIILVSPDLRGVKKSQAQELVVIVHAAGDQDLFVAGKCDGALAAARQDAAAWDRCFIERSEIRSRGNSIGVVKTRYICAEDEDFTVGEQG